MNFQLEKKFNTQNLTATESQISGYATIFDAVDQQGDRVSRGAFENCLAKKSAGEIKMLWQHDPCKPIGVWQSVVEDEIGLKVEGYLLDNIQAGQEAIALMNAGAVRGLSIGYRTLRSAKNNQGERILKDVDLWEISLVTFPMLNTAQAELNQAESVTDFRRAFRDLIESLKE